MKNCIVTGMTIITALSLAACASKEIAPPPQPEVASYEKYDPQGRRLERANTLTVSAVVTDIDLDKRLVTLKGPEGNERTIEVGPEVRNLPQVKRGDMVTLTYIDSATFRLLKPGEAELGGTMSEISGRAKPGEKPGAGSVQTMTVIARVKKVDKVVPSLTLEGPDGDVVTLPVRHPERLDAVKVGDLLEITYDEAIAIEVEEPEM